MSEQGTKSKVIVIFEPPKDAVQKIFGNVSVPYGQVYGQKTSVFSVSGQCDCENGSCDCNCSCECTCD